MKEGLPTNHGLSQKAVDTLVFKENGTISLSDIQYASLENGVGRGESALVVAPTSTGKTHIALWSIASGIENLCNTVYLVTHRALANQKFEEFKSSMLESFLDNDRSSLVIATGDYVLNAAGDAPSDPLNSPLLIATYEKYLALLSASGIPTNMDSTTIICDEIQLIGDQHRGQHVEVLLTLILNAGWKQFVGLSAVLDEKDASDLANWLNVKLVLEHSREKQLNYECWTDNGIMSANTAQPDQINAPTAIPAGVNLDSLSVLYYLVNLPNPPEPIIVFCMKKQDTYDLAKRFINVFLRPPKGQLSLAFDELPETNANVLLSEIIDHGVGVHNADLMDEERHIIEERLSKKQLNIIFATSTLAAGVNFPLGAAIFSSWTRWNKERRTQTPIESSEFHNMAGRTGRMGYDHEAGRVIFFARNHQEIQVARQYLQLGALPSITPRINQKHFNGLSLQLIASGLCTTRDSLINLVCRTFSGLREQDRNLPSFEEWPNQLNGSIDFLCQNGLLIASNNGQLTSTPVGKAIGYSGLLPETGVFLLNYIVDKVEAITDCLPTIDEPGDINKLSFLIFSACFSSPEFRPQQGLEPTRFLPWPLRKEAIFNADAYANDLVEPAWYADCMPINAAKLSTDWIGGSQIKNLETSLVNLSAGMLGEMFRNLVWIIKGLSSIITAASDSRTPMPCRPASVQIDDASLALLRKIPRVLKRLSYRVTEGLPDSVLWMKSLNAVNGDFRITRHEILSLHEQEFVSPEQLIQGSPLADQARMNAFLKSRPSPHAKSNWLRDSCRQWKVQQRQNAARKQIEKSKRLGIDHLFSEYYTSTGDNFELAFEGLLEQVGIAFKKIDDKTKTGAPDYAIELSDGSPIVVELKSKQGNGLVDYNKAVEVLAAAEIHGYQGCYCVTLCHPGVDPSVPTVIASSGRLCVVESHDFGEALLRIAQRSLSQGKLWEWLTTPGQALIDDLAFKEYST